MLNKKIAICITGEFRLPYTEYLDEYWKRFTPYADIFFTLNDNSNEFYLLDNWMYKVYEKSFLKEHMQSINTNLVELPGHWRIHDFLYEQYLLMQLGYYYYNLMNYDIIIRARSDFLLVTKNDLGKTYAELTYDDSYFYNVVKFFNDLPSHCIGAGYIYNYRNLLEVYDQLWYVKDNFDFIKNFWKYGELNNRVNSPASLVTAGTRDFFTTVEQLFFGTIQNYLLINNNNNMQYKAHQFIPFIVRPNITKDFLLNNKLEKVYKVAFDYGIRMYETYLDDNAFYTHIENLGQL